MIIEKSKVKIRCEMGACKGFSCYTIKLARVGIRSRIHMCEACLKGLSKAIIDLFKLEQKPLEKTPPKDMPKSIETLKPKKGSKKEL